MRIDKRGQWLVQLTLFSLLVARIASVTILPPKAEALEQTNNTQTQPKTLAILDKDDDIPIKTSEQSKRPLAAAPPASSEIENVAALESGSADLKPSPVNVSPRSGIDILKPEDVPIQLQLFCEGTHAALNWSTNGTISTVGSSINLIRYIVLYRISTAKTKDPVQDDWTRLVVTPLSNRTTNTTRADVFIQTNAKYEFEVRSEMWYTPLGKYVEVSKSQLQTCQTEDIFPQKASRILSAFKNPSSSEITLRWTPVEEIYHGSIGFSYLIQFAPILKQYPISNWNTTEATFDLGLDGQEKNIETIRVKIDTLNLIGSYKNNDVWFEFNLNQKQPEQAPEEINVESLDGRSVNISWKAVPLSKVNGNFKGMSPCALFGLSS